MGDGVTGGAWAALIVMCVLPAIMLFGYGIRDMWKDRQPRRRKDEGDSGGP